MKNILSLLFCLVSIPLFSQGNIKALVGGTLIGGFGGTPIRNSIIIIEGEKKTGSMLGFYRKYYQFSRCAVSWINYSFLPLSTCCTFSVKTILLS